MRMKHVIQFYQASQDQDRYHRIAMPTRLKYSLIMFLAGCSYGFVVPLVKTAQLEAFSTGQIMVTQYIVAVITLCLTCLLFSRTKVSLKNALQLMGLGIIGAGVSFCYYHALELLAPAMALTLLFQFVWMGMVVQAVSTKTRPQTSALLAVLLVVVGAVLATGILDENISLQNLDLTGILFGFMSALCYTAFLALSGRIALQLPAVNRSMFTTLGSLIISFVITPRYFSESMLTLDLPVSIGLGLLGICLPVFLIAVSSPKLPTGLTTVMASSELPSGVICAALFLGEAVSFAIGLGVAIVLLGIVLSESETLRLLLAKPDRDNNPPQQE